MLKTLTSREYKKTLGLPLRVGDHSHFCCQGNGSPFIFRRGYEKENNG
uniref:Uncharacterized protein n=1 Tax=viral metagenome TaxID=1070528 RepID=A0A6M3LQ10_9ZZZZ